MLDVYQKQQNVIDKQQAVIENQKEIIEKLTEANISLLKTVDIYEGVFVKMGIAFKTIAPVGLSS